MGSELKFKNLLEEYRKVALLTVLYTEKRTALHHLNEKQNRMNRSINAKKNKVNQMYNKKARDIMEGKHKQEPGILKQVFTQKFVFYTVCFLALYFIFSKLAYMQRGYKVIGGEGFFLAIPVLIFFYKLGTIIDKKARKMNK